jgi:hypothetical protein
MTQLCVATQTAVMVGRETLTEREIVCLRRRLIRRDVLRAGVSHARALCALCQTKGTLLDTLRRIFGENVIPRRISHRRYGLGES